MFCSFAGFRVLGSNNSRWSCRTRTCKSNASADDSRHGGELSRSGCLARQHSQVYTIRARTARRRNWPRPHQSLPSHLRKPVWCPRNTMGVTASQKQCWNECYRCFFLGTASAKQWHTLNSRARQRAAFRAAGPGPASLAVTRDGRFRRQGHRGPHGSVSRTVVFRPAPAPLDEGCRQHLLLQHELPKQEKVTPSCRRRPTSLASRPDGRA